MRLVDSVAESFAELVDGLVASKAPTGCSLFLSGGSTAVACYAALAARGRTPGWSSVDVFLGDERCVPPNDPDSNHRMIAEALLSVVGPVRSDHPMYTGGTPSAAADAYQELVASVGRPDLVHLGIGPDGHTASLFPDSVALLEPEEGRLVAINQDPHGVNPYPRVTLTLAGIATARLVVVTVSGRSKRDALTRIMAGEDLPGGRVHGDEVLWLVDAAAIGGPVHDAVTE